LLTARESASLRVSLFYCYRPRERGNASRLVRFIQRGTRHMAEVEPSATVVPLKPAPGKAKERVPSAKRSRGKRARKPEPTAAQPGGPNRSQQRPNPAPQTM